MVDEDNTISYEEDVQIDVTGMVSHMLSRAFCPRCSTMSLALVSTEESKDLEIDEVHIVGQSDTGLLCSGAVRCLNCKMRFTVHGAVASKKWTFGLDECSDGNVGKICSSNGDSLN